MTNGMKTSEFWGKTILQIASIVLGVLVMSDVITVEISDEIMTTLTALILLLLEVGYGISRGLAKSKK